MNRAFAAVLMLVLLTLTGCSHELPARYDPTVFTPENGFSQPAVRLGSGPSGRFLILVPVEGVMAFTTPSNFLGLYTSSGELEAEARLGAIAVELVSWSTDAIVLRCLRFHEMSSADQDSVNWGLPQLHRLGPYRLEVRVD